jgi:hypothetical protein
MYIYNERKKGREPFMVRGQIMIIGNGDIASVLIDRSDRFYFAAGVSNSLETNESEYWREVELFLKQERGVHFVYFSSLAVFYSNSRYARHKREMEKNVRMRFEEYTILRIGNITWGKNPNTLINFIKDKIKNREPFEIQDVYRYICDKEEFLYWIDMIPDWSCEMNIVGRRMKVKDIVKEYCYPWEKEKWNWKDGVA